jgi:hypothetical protein
MSPRVPSGETKMISEPLVRSTQMVHLSLLRISTISKWTELSFEPQHLGVPSGASKTISELRCIWLELCTCLALTLTQYPIGKK